MLTAMFKFIPALCTSVQYSKMCVLASLLLLLHQNGPECPLAEQERVLQDFFDGIFLVDVLDGVGALDDCLGHPRVTRHIFESESRNLLVLILCCLMTNGPSALFLNWTFCRSVMSYGLSLQILRFQKHLQKPSVFHTFLRLKYQSKRIGYEIIYLTSFRLHRSYLLN